MNRGIVRIALATAAILLIPLLGNSFVDGWDWSFADFGFAGALIFGTGLAFERVRNASHSRAYKAAAGIALGASFLLVWINAAVGVIGDDNPANLLYLAVIAIGFIGAILSRLESRGMARVMFAMAVAQLIVPLVALGIDSTDFAPGVVGVFVLNAAFATLFIGSGLLFMQAWASGSVPNRA